MTCRHVLCSGWFDLSASLGARDAEMHPLKLQEESGQIQTACGQTWIQSRQQTADSRQQTAGAQEESGADNRLQADSGQQTADSNLEESKMIAQTPRIAGAYSM
jgi:hypothetical protein